MYTSADIQIHLSLQAQTLLQCSDGAPSVLLIRKRPPRPPPLNRVIINPQFKIISGCKLLQSILPTFARAGYLKRSDYWVNLSFVSSFLLTTRTCALTHIVHNSSDCYRRLILLNSSFLARIDCQGEEISNNVQNCHFVSNRRGKRGETQAIGCCV